MSLFKVCDIWSVDLRNKHYFHKSCFFVSALNNFFPLENFIIVGDNSGVISIYLPKKNTEGDNLDLTFINHENDLCLVQQLKYSILSILCGNFNPTKSNFKQIAILHPDNYSFYDFRQIDNKITDNEFNANIKIWELTLSYEQNLPNVFSMCLCKLNNTDTYDSICVQQTDGTFCICNFSGILLKFYICDIIVPGPIAFLLSNESFVTVLNSRILCSITYKSIKNGSFNYKIDNLNMDWSIVLNNPIFDINVLEIEDTSKNHFPLSFIITLGRNNLTICSETGLILCSKKFDSKLYRICTYTYIIYNFDDNSRSIGSMYKHGCTWEPCFLIATEDKQLLVFKVY